MSTLSQLSAINIYLTEVICFWLLKPGNMREPLTCQPDQFSVVIDSDYIGVKPTTSNTNPTQGEVYNIM